MKLSYLSKVDLKKKIIIISVLFPLIIGGLIFLIIIPAINDIKNIKNGIENQRIGLEIKYKKGQSINKLIKDLKIIEPQLFKLNQIFISKGKVLEFITALEEIANKEYIDQKINLASSNGADSGGYQKIPLQIVTNGNFIKQLNYLIDIESLNYYVNIKSLEIRTDSARSVNLGKQTKESAVNMLIFADTYWQ